MLWEKRSKTNARLTFQRQRVINIGAWSTAGSKTSRSVWLCRNPNTESSGKLCFSPSEITIPLSVAAACSSKSKVTQNRFLKARPQARLIRPPKGVCKTNCIPPLSSKNRSATIVCCVGTVPSTALPASTYSMACCAPR